MNGRKLTAWLLSLCVLFLTAPAWNAERANLVHTVVNVTTSSTTVVLARSGTRSLLVLQNDSDTTIYCNITGAAAVLNQGVRLNDSGGTLFMDVVVPTVTVACIHGGTGNKALLVTEG